MPSKNLLATYEFKSLDTAIKKRNPHFTDAQIATVRTRLLNFIAKGLANGYEIAALRAVGDDEVKIKILRISEKDKTLKLRSPKFPK